MLNLPHSLVIEATDDPAFFCFYAPTLPGFTGAGTSVGDCIEQCGPAMTEWRDYLAEVGAAVPPPDAPPVVLVCDEAGPSKIPEIDWDNDDADLDRLIDPADRDPADLPRAAAA